MNDNTALSLKLLSLVVCSREFDRDPQFLVFILPKDHFILHEMKSGTNDIEVQSLISEIGQNLNWIWTEIPAVWNQTGFGLVSNRSI